MNAPPSPSPRVRRLSIAAIDAVLWAGALAAIVNFAPVDGLAVSGWVAVGGSAVSAQWVLGYASGLYRGRASLGSADQAVLLAAVVLTTGAVAAAVGWSAASDLGVRLLGRSSGSGGLNSWAAVRVVAVAMLLVLLAAGALRFVIRRTMLERRRAYAPGARRVLIFGAGCAGQQLIQSMIITGRLDAGGGKRAGDLLPVGLLDDDRARRRLRLLGVPVLGTRADIAEVARSTGATMLVLAIPSADAALVRFIAAESAAAGLTLKTLPTLAELATLDTVGVGDLRDIQMADLLGRHQIDTDVAAIAGYLTGRRVLVTGAGGSIGSELCRQIHRFKPAELIMLDRDESALHAVQLSIYGAAALDTSDVVLADIRDAPHVRAIFERRAPEVVFHAAALKHLTMLEQYPGEAVKTNVWGTATVLAAAQHVGVSRFVNISTDKAANPCSVLGYSKRLAEGLTAEADTRSRGTFLSVRFGNVLGSRGSMVTTFTAQIESGGPVTVTDPDVTRYFMTVEEAVQLVIQGAAIGRGGEALVLDMGEPVRIADVANQLISMSGRSVEVVYTGLHHGEKLHEELFGAGEPDVRPIHELISHVPVMPLAPTAALRIDPHADRVEVVRRVAGLCATLDAAWPADSPPRDIVPGTAPASATRRPSTVGAMS